VSHHQANLEPLNISEFLLTVLFVSKVADPCVSSNVAIAITTVESNYLLYLLCSLKINKLNTLTEYNRMDMLRVISTNGFQ
jgi:hypothetical protein